MSSDVRLEQHFPISLAVVRRRAGRHEFSRVVPEACGLVWNALRSQNITGAGRHVAIYLDDVINLEVGAVLDSPYTGDGSVVASATPAGRVATTTHLGRYGNLGLAHQTVQDWCRDNGHCLAGPCWEIYGHWQDDWIKHPERIRTDVYYLLK